MSDDLLSFNGINARTGEPLLRLTQAELTQLASGEPLDPENLHELLDRHTRAGRAHFGVIENVSQYDLAQSGWGLVLPMVMANTPAARQQADILEALEPLIRHRRAEAERVDPRRFRVYAALDGCRRDDSKSSFLSRHNVGPGPANPDQMPYYLLIVGDPAEISFRFQSQLSVQRAVGRIHFDTLSEYASYAESVVKAERGQVVSPRRAAFFGVSNPGDFPTRTSAQELVAPLADLLRADRRFADWKMEPTLGEAATRSALIDLLSGGDAPALLFTASHGLGFPKDDPLQRRHQGALLCQDWPGELAWGSKPIPEEFYLAGDHLSSDISLLGNISFFFACYGAGTPEHDEHFRLNNNERRAIASRAFVADLPRAMLNRPKGGALAVVGHVDRAWSTSFQWEGARRSSARQISVFQSTMASLLSGLPLGAAMEYFDERYAEIASDLSVLLEDKTSGIPIDELALTADWTANNDARGYAIIGDPAVRLAGGASGATRARAELIDETKPDVRTANPVAAPATEPAAKPAAELDPEAQPLSFAFLNRPDQTPEEPTALERVINRLADLLSEAVKDASSLEVSTWVADDLTNARYEGGQMVGAERRAFTHLALDGDTVVCLTQRAGEVDREVWDIHMAMVKQAQETRAELLKSLVSVAASLPRRGK